MVLPYLRHGPVTSILFQGGMEERLNLLIAERAPWLFKRAGLNALCRRMLMSLLDYENTLTLAHQLRDQSPQAIAATMEGLIARHVSVSGLHNIPPQGPALVVANHPTGIADGIVVQHALGAVRRDVFFYANADILRVLPQLDRMIAPVEWRKGQRSHAKTRETLAYTRKAIREKRLGVIFPSGRLAKRCGLRLRERPWMASAAMIARKYDLPVIPVHVQAHNSALFYALDMLHPTLRDVTLFHETLNKDKQPFEITIGAPIEAETLPKKSEDAIALLHQKTMALGEEAHEGIPISFRLKQTSRFFGPAGMRDKKSSTTA
ncbi:MAG: 1-acyl-sn-glycerol-3-phosphate acyltransferase [Pseudomonadota bacterium]